MSQLDTLGLSIMDASLSQLKDFYGNKADVQEELDQLGLPMPKIYPSYFDILSLYKYFSNHKNDMVFKYVIHHNNTKSCGTFPIAVLRFVPEKQSDQWIVNLMTSDIIHFINKYTLAKFSKRAIDSLFKEIGSEFIAFASISHPTSVTWLQWLGFKANGICKMPTGAALQLVKRV